MKLIIENIEKIIEVNGVPARVWEGTTESGINVTCLITRVAVSKEEDPGVHAHFQTELQQTRPPSAEVQAWPLRLIL